MTHQNEILHWIKLRRIAFFFWGKFKAYSSQRVYFQKRKVAEMNLNLSLQRWRGHLHVRASQAWFHADDYRIARDVCGCDHIIGELRRERLDLALVSYGLFYQRIFVFDMTDMKTDTSSFL